jgi:galactokinase
MERAATAFLARFGHAPEYTAPAPGRINLIGEHTDYNGGLVLPMAIGLSCVAVGAESKTKRSRLFAVDLGEEFSFELKGDLSRYLNQPSPGGVPRGHWASYILGVLDGFRQAGIKLPPLDIAIASEIPIGAGLSSSAALEVSTAILVQSVLGEEFDAIDLAYLCRDAEHAFAGVPCGIMDQFAVILGEPGQAILIDCATEQVTPVPLPPPDRAAILIIDTQVRHKLADGEYALRRAMCASAAAKLGVKDLGSAGLDELSRTTLTDDERRCATHVLGENARVRRAVEALEKQDLESFGHLMYESHKSLRDDYRVSCPELDTIVDIARTVPGIYGARMTGAGFGGSAIALLEPPAVALAADTISAGFLKAHGHRCRAFLAGP